MRVRELVPGMVFRGIAGPMRTMQGTVICTTAHPIFPGFTLVVWKMSDGSMSFDALSPMQELPTEWIGQNREQMDEAWKKAVGLNHG